MGALVGTLVRKRIPVWPGRSEPAPLPGHPGTPGASGPQTRAPAQAFTGTVSRLERDPCGTAAPGGWPASGSGSRCAASARRAEHGGVADYPERLLSPFTPVEMREMWTYSDGSVTVKGYWWPSGTARAGSWVLVDQATGNVQGVVPAGEFSRRFRPVDVFADVPRLPAYLGTVTAPDGTALVDLVLDRNPFMLANGPRRAARPHVLMVPRSHRDGWSSATASELAARQTAMILVAAWYCGLDGGHAVFCANDSAPNLDYLRDMEAASGTLSGSGPEAAITRNPRQDVQHAHLHAFYAGTWRDREPRVFGASRVSRCCRGSAGVQCGTRQRRRTGGAGLHEARRRRSLCRAAVGW